MPIRRAQYIIGTGAEWAEKNPVLADGQLGIDTTTNTMRMGDGSTVWASLPFYGDDVPALRQVSAAVLKGKTIVGGTFAWNGSSVRASAGTSRRAYKVLTAASMLRATYTQAINNIATWVDGDPAAGVPIRGKWRITKGGVSTEYRMTYGGLPDVTLSGALTHTDPLAIEVEPGDIVEVVTYTSSTAWYSNGYTPTAFGFGGFIVGDQTAPGATYVADTASTVLLLPLAITGTPLDDGSKKATILISGDSIAHGAGDAGQNVAFVGINQQGTSGAVAVHPGGGGFVSRALTALGLASLSVATPGDNATKFIVTANHYRRMLFANDVTTVVAAYGHNDLGSVDNSTTVKASIIAHWLLFSRLGKRVIQTTITPTTTSTDGWFTVGSQTVGVTNAARVPVNQWLRAGAPMVNGAAVAIGTLGALLAGDPGHPCSQVADITTPLETAIDSGIFKAAVNVRSITDAVTTANGSLITSATANFTAADEGRATTIPGAGAAGVLYVSTIAHVYSATSALLILQVPTAFPAGTPASIGDAMVVDGTHMTPYGHALSATPLQAATYV